MFYPHGKFVQDNQHGVGAIQDYTANMFNFKNADYPEEAQEPSAKVNSITHETMKRLLGGQFDVKVFLPQELLYYKMYKTA